MKKLLLLVLIFGVSVPVFSQNFFILDEALHKSYMYLKEKIPAGSIVAVLNFKSEWPGLTDYIIDKLSSYIVDDKNLTVVDRSNLETIQREMGFQLSGEVSEGTMQRIGQKWGAQTIISGSFSSKSKTLQIRAVSVETSALQGVFSVDIQVDERLAKLTGIDYPLNNIPALSKTLDERINAAISKLFEEVKDKDAAIGIGRITANSGINKKLPDFLKKEIIKRRTAGQRYRIVTDYTDADISTSTRRGGSEPSIWALIDGDVSLIKEGVAVNLQLVSTINKALLGSGDFIIYNTELEQNNLLPEKIIPKTFDIASSTQEKAASKVTKLLEGQGFVRNTQNPSYRVTITVGNIPVEKEPEVFMNVKPSLHINIISVPDGNGVYSYTGDIEETGKLKRINSIHDNALKNIEKNLDEHFINDFNSKFKN